MTVLRTLLLIPLMVPLLAVLLVGAINPRPSQPLRLLLWTTPALPLGAWIAAAGAAGACLSAVATSLALRQGSAASIPPRQWQRRSRAADTPDQQEPEPWHRPQSTGSVETAGAPSRQPGEPAPTVEVPFRVIRRPGSSASRTTEPARPGRTTQAPEPTRATPTEAAQARDPHGADGWDQNPDDAWE